MTRSVLQLLVVVLCQQLILPTTALGYGTRAATNGSSLIENRGSTGANDTGPPTASEDSISFMGAARHAVPIDVPPGTGGLTPSLSLRYTSGARSPSWVGFGWDLTAGAIQRSLREGVPTYGDSVDTFDLDGQPLVRSLDPGQATRFHTRQESFLRIEQTGNSWQVRAKDGTVSRYGIDNNSRIDNLTKAGAPTFAWLLAEQEDVHGNIVQYVYDESDPGQRYLSELRYTLRRPGATLLSLNGNAAPDDSVDRVIRFSMEARPDRRLSYDAGFLRELNQRLARIDVMTAGALMRRYELAYSVSPDSYRSLLSEVRAYGSDAALQTSTAPRVQSFTYSSSVALGRRGWGPTDPDDVSQVAMNWSLPNGIWIVNGTNGRDNGVRFAELNGDGRIDVIRETRQRPTDMENDAGSGAWLNTPSGFTSAPEYRLPISANEGRRMAFVQDDDQTIATRFATEGVVLADFNRDGRADVLRLVNGHRIAASLTDHEFYFDHEYHVRTDVGWDVVLAAMNAPGTTANAGEGVGDPTLSFAFKLGVPRNLISESHVTSGFARIAELNGDGRPDLIMQTRETQLVPDDENDPAFDVPQPVVADWLRKGIVRPRRDGSGFGPLEVGPYVLPCLPEESPYPWMCEARTEFGEIEWTYFLEYQSEEIIWDLPIERHHQWGKRHVDFNGDGLDDSISSYLVGDSEVHLNEGSDYGPADDRWTLPSVVALEQLEQSSYPWISIDRGYRFVDINGDGQNELIGGGQNLWIGTESYDNQWIEVPNNDPWRIPSGCHTAEGAPGITGNDRGVRYVDLNGDGLTDLIYSQKSFPVKIFLNQGVVPDLLKTATNPHGGITTFTYGPSTSYDNTGDDDLPDLPMVVQVVTKITFDDRNGSLGFTVFDYQGGRFDGEDREFRGFAQVAATRSVDGRRTVTRYHQDDARSGLPALVAVSDHLGNLWSSVETTYTPDDIAPYVSLPETVTRSEYDGQPNPRRSRVEFRYDDLQPSPGGDSPITLGNRTATIEFGEMDSAGTDVDPSDTRTTETTFAPANPATHLADRIAVQRLRAGSEPGEGAMLRASWFYYDGHTSTSAVPTLGELTRRIDLVGVGGEVNPVTTFSYDAYGNLETETSPRENSGELAAGLGTTTHTYDALLSTYVSSVTNGLGHTWQFGYSPLPGACPVANPPGAGLVHAEEGPNDIGAGTSTRRCYDAFGRPTLEEGPGALTRTEWTYDDNLQDLDGTKVTAFVRVNAAGSTRETVSHLDGLGRIYLSDTDGPGGQTVRQVTVYDTAGRIAGQTDPYYTPDSQRITAFAFDTLDRQTQVTRPGLRVNRVDYDRGKVTLTDPNNLVTVREIDAFGQVRAVIEHGSSPGDKTNYAYNLAGELVRVTDRRGNETAITYDSLGQRRTLNDPDSGLTTYVAYDANGNLKQQTSGGGTLSWTYDALDRVLTRSAGGATDSWTYDTAARGKGLLARQTDASGFYQVEQYDLLGRVTHERYNRDGKTFPFQNTYTPLSEPNTRTYPTARVLKHVYDAKGFLTGIRTQGGSDYASGIQWEADGRPRRWTLGNTDRSEFLYETFTGRIDHIRLLSPSQSVLDDLDYSFDSGDRVDAIAATVGSFDFDYDALNRLTQATGPYGDGLQAKTLQYAYDSIGNLTCHGAANRENCADTGGTVLAYPNPSPGVPRPHAPVTVNGETVGYTASGNLTSRGDRSYEYDAHNQLLAARKAGRLLAEFRYDAAGRRIRAIDRSDPRNLTRHLVAADFDWDATRALAHIHVTIGSARIASQVDAFTPATASVWAPREVPRGMPWTLVFVGTPAAVAALLLLLQLAALRRRGTRLFQPALAGTTCIFFYLSLVTPSLAQVPDGDLNGDTILDAADALLSLQIASGDLTPTSAHEARGDVAPLEAAPDGLLDVADALLVLRAVRGEDVDGDALLTADELAAGASPFRADTDGDGLSDFAEVTIHGTDPAKEDTDDDGLSDADEIQTHQTDPTEADTDGDGLTDGADPEKRSGVAYQHTDHLGSTAIQLAPDGSVVRRLVYRPYGQAVAPTSGGIAKVPTFGFTGQRFEKKLGLYDYGARWYDPALGRFLQPDTMVPEPSDPQSLNRYSYVRNNPLNRIDPNGHADRAGGVFGFFGVTQPQLDSFQAVLSTGGLFPAAGNILDAVNVVVDVLALDKGSAVGDAIAMVDGPGQVAGAVMIGARTGGKVAAKAAAEAIGNAAGREARGAAKEVVGEAATKEALGGAPTRSAQQRGRDSEARVLADIGETKNTQKLSTSHGNTIPDFQNSTTVGDIKDASRVSDTRQMRAQREAAASSGREHVVVTGEKTKVSGPLSRNSTIKQRKDLGPSESSDSEFNFND